MHQDGRSLFPVLSRVALIALALITLLAQTLPVAYASDTLDTTMTPAVRALQASAQQRGSVRLIVGLQVQSATEGVVASPATDQVQQQRVSTAQQGLLQRLSGRNVRSTAQFQYIPFMGVEADAAAVEALNNDAGVTSIQEDRVNQPTLDESIPLIGGNTDGSFGTTKRTGAGQTVAVLDTGVMRTHTFLANKVVSEACYSTTSAANSSTAFCQSGSTAVGSGVNCPVSISGCDHGTHVAGIVAGKGTSFNGVAKDANIIAIQVFSRFDVAECGTCPSAYDSDVLKGLERVYTLRTQFNISSVNMSLGGGGPYATNCDAQNAAYKTAIDNLLSVGIATLIATGNESFTTGVASPACVSSAVSVGSTTKSDDVSDFSNSGQLVDILTPGSDIWSSVASSTTAFGYKSGTSMATPHVAGAWAVIRQQNPAATPAQVLAALQNTGVTINDTRNNIARKRISLTQAVNSLPTNNPVPALTSVSPTTIGNGSATFTLTVNGSNFAENATVRWNGTDRPTTFVSANKLTATISAADVAAPAAMPVTVFNPEPAGGTSGKMNFTVASSCNSSEPNNTLATAKAIQNGQTQLHSFCATGDEDWIAFTAEMNKRYTLKTLALSSVSKVNTIMSLYDATGKLLVAESADVSTDPASSIVFNPTKAGTYYVKLRNRPGSYGATFTYNINLSSIVVPVVTSLTPPSREAGFIGFTLVVKGQNFDRTSVVRWNGVGRPTTFVSPTELHAEISKPDIGIAGTNNVLVHTPAPGAGKSNMMTFTVTPMQPAPISTVTGLSKTSVEAGGESFVLAVYGNNFAQRSVVRWNGVGRTTTWISAKEARITLSAADLANTGTRTVAVNTPAPGGGLSNSVNFTITPKQTGCTRDEPNDTFTQAKILVAGDEREYGYCKSGDKDIVKLTTPANSVYVIDTALPGRYTDTKIVVYDKDGNFVQSFDAAGMGQNEGVRITNDETTPLTYYFEFYDYWNEWATDGTTNYTVRVTKESGQGIAPTSGTGTSIEQVFPATK